MGNLLAIALLIAGQPKVYVEGYGWAPAKAVGHCLVAVGAPHVDVLYDGQWEEFSDCLSANT